MERNRVTDSPPGVAHLTIKCRSTLDDEHEHSHAALLSNTSEREEGEVATCGLTNFCCKQLRVGPTQPGAPL